MRFCPYCSAENVDQAGECERCGRRFLPLPAPGSRATGAAAAIPAPSGPGLAGPPGSLAPGPGGSLGGDRMVSGVAGVVQAPVRARRTAPLPSPTTGPIRSMEPELPPRPEGTPSAERDSLADIPELDVDPDTELQPEPPTTVAVADFSEPSGPEPSLAPPPTRQVAPGAAPTSVAVDPLPEPPDGGLLPSLRYTIAFARGSWQRRQAVRGLDARIRTDTTALDGLLGALGRTVRQLRLNNRTLAAENQAIDEAEGRRSQAETDAGELARRLDEENQRFSEQEQDRENKRSEVEAALDKADKELDSLEAQRRSLRDKRKTIERQQRAYVKTADDREVAAAKATAEEERAQFQRAAEDMRCEAAALDPERQDLDRRLTTLEKPVSQAAAKVEALRGEQESIRRALLDLREGHRQRLSELEAEHGRKGRDVTTAEAEVGRRLVTLGTLLHLNRIERPEFDELYARIDQLRGAIGACTQEIDRLNAEREAFDRGTLMRGVATLGLGVVILTTVVVLIAALL